MIINLTKHPIELYDPLVPNTFVEGEYKPVLTIPASGTVARIEERERAPKARAGTEVLILNGLYDPVDVEYGHIVGLPVVRPFTWYVVSLALALAVRGERHDLLVPWRQVRNRTSTVIGCRGLARAV